MAVLAPGQDRQGSREKGVSAGGRWSEDQAVRNISALTPTHNQLLDITAPLRRPIQTGKP